MYEDTSPEAMNVWVGLMRDAPPGRKMDRVSSLNRLVMGNARRVIAERHPAWSVDRVNVEFVRTLYGDALARGVAEKLGVGVA